MSDLVLARQVLDDLMGRNSATLEEGVDLREQAVGYIHQLQRSFGREWTREQMHTLLLFCLGRDEEPVMRSLADSNAIGMIARQAGWTARDWQPMVAALASSAHRSVRRAMPRCLEYLCVHNVPLRRLGKSGISVSLTPTQRYQAVCSLDYTATIKFLIKRSTALSGTRASILHVTASALACLKQSSVATVFLPASLQRLQEQIEHYACDVLKDMNTSPTRSHACDWAICDAAGLALSVLYPSPLSCHGQFLSPLHHSTNSSLPFNTEDIYCPELTAKLVNVCLWTLENSASLFAMESALDGLLSYANNSVSVLASQHAWIQEFLQRLLRAASLHCRLSMLIARRVGTVARMAMRSALCLCRSQKSEQTLEEEDSEEVSRQLRECRNMIRIILGSFPHKLMESNAACNSTDVKAGMARELPVLSYLLLEFALVMNTTNTSSKHNSSNQCIIQTKFVDLFVRLSEQILLIAQKLNDQSEVQVELTQWCVAAQLCELAAPSLNHLPTPVVDALCKNSTVSRHTLQSFLNSDVLEVRCAGMNVAVATVVKLDNEVSEDRAVKAAQSIMKAWIETPRVIAGWRTHIRVAEFIPLIGEIAILHGGLAMNGPWISIFLPQAVELLFDKADGVRQEALRGLHDAVFRPVAGRCTSRLANMERHMTGCDVGERSSAPPAGYSPVRVAESLVWRVISKHKRPECHYLLRAMRLRAATALRLCSPDCVAIGIFFEGLQDSVSNVRVTAAELIHLAFVGGQLHLSSLTSTESPIMVPALSPEKRKQLSTRISSLSLSQDVHQILDPFLLMTPNALRNRRNV